MKTYKIPILWESYETFEVEAENLEEAILTALNQFLSTPDENYIDDSFSIDSIVSDNYPDESFNLNDIFNKL